MASKRQRKCGTWEYLVKNKKLLPKPLYLTFDTEAEGDIYVERLEKLLKAGHVPEEFKTDPAEGALTIRELIRKYCSEAEPTDSDVANLNTQVGRVGSKLVGEITLSWVEDWVDEMKFRYNSSPSTIKHHVGAMARCFDWGLRKALVKPENNVIRMLGKKYSTYSKKDVAAIQALSTPEAPLEVRHSLSRFRRLQEGEEAAIRAVLNRQVDINARSILVLPYRLALEFMFELALETGMRMREIYTLTFDQIDVSVSTIYLDKTKNGDNRQVPMSSIALATYKAYLLCLERNDPSMNGFEIKHGRVFPWWDGSFDKKYLKGLTSALSKQFNRIFAKAGLVDFHFHDIRHEATSRFFEKTTMDFVEIAKITGHKDPRMLMVYANLRGSQLAKKLW